MESDLKYNEKLVEQYKLSCEVCGTYPDPKFCKQFSKGELMLDLSSLDTTSSNVFCYSFSQPLVPFLIEIHSSCTKNITEEKKILQNILNALAVTLKTSKSLFNIKFSNVSILPSMIAVLSQGLSVTKKLQSLRFFNCNLQHAVVEKISSSIKNVACITTLTFEHCQINYKSFQVINSLVMHQCLNRTSLMWKDTLRFQHPNTDRLNGLRYLILNNNPLIGDEGVNDLTEALADDIWMTGIEVENCGITPSSSEAILNLLKVNKVLKRFSLKNNPFLQSDFISKVEDVLAERNPTPKPEFNLTFIEKSTPKKVERRYQKISLDETMKSKFEIPQKLKDIDPGVPWRVEGRLLERSEGLPIGSLTLILEEIQNAKMRKRKYETKDEIDLGISVQNIQNVIHFYKSKWKSESKRRIQAEKKLRRAERKLHHYQELLKKNYILDEDTFVHVEQCFSSFQNFLIKLQKVGYVDQNDVDEELSENSLKFSSIPVANQRVRERHSNSSKSSSRHSISRSEKNSAKTSVSSKRNSISSKSSKSSKSSQTVFSLPENINTESERDDSSEMSSKKSLNTKVEKDKLSEKLEGKQEEDKQSVGESTIKSNSYSEEFENSANGNISSSKKTGSIAGSRGSHDDRGEPEENKTLSNSSSRSSQKESIAEEVRSTKSSSTESNRSKLKIMVNKTFNNDDDIQPELDGSGDEGKSKSEIQNNGNIVGRSGCQSFEMNSSVTKKNIPNSIRTDSGRSVESVKSTSTSVPFNLKSTHVAPIHYTDSEQNEGSDLSSSSSEPFNIKNIHITSVPLGKSMDESLSEVNALGHVATDDEKISKIVAESLSRQNSRVDSTVVANHKEISYTDDNQETDHCITNDTHSDLKQSLGDEPDTPILDNNGVSPLFSLRNSRQPSLTSISEQLSLSHERWTGKRSSKSKSRPEEFGSEFDESNSGDISAAASFSVT